MSRWYAVANGRETGVYDNWEDCKEQVHGYSHNKYKRFDSPDEAWDFVDQHSSDGRAGKSFNDRAIACRNNNQVALRDYRGEATSYRRTDYTEGRNTIVVRERSYRSGTDGRGHYVEKYTRTYWKDN